jgi:hypothetical protein
MSPATAGRLSRRWRILQGWPGHGGGTTRAQAIDQQTERLAFFAASLGLHLAAN